MLYSALLKAAFRTVYGPLPEPSADGDARAGLVLVADGVGGLDLCVMGLRYMVPRAGLPYRVRGVPWQHGFGRWHADLTDVANHAAKAAAVADEVEAFRAERPKAPAFLIGKSGGCGVIVRALEALPEGAVEAAVLLSPALSPGYDLTPALRAVRREMVVFWSPLDVFILGLGTRIFGTIDRVRAASAGMVSFRVPERLDEAGRAHYARLRQVRWHPGMATTGYLGGHVGPDAPRFLRKYVVPLLGLAGHAADPSPAVSSRPDAAPIT